MFRLRHDPTRSFSFTSFFRNSTSFHENTSPALPAAPRSCRAPRTTPDRKSVQNPVLSGPETCKGLVCLHILLFPGDLHHRAKFCTLACTPHRATCTRLARAKCLHAILHYSQGTCTRLARSLHVYRASDPTCTALARGSAGVQAVCTPDAGQKRARRVRLHDACTAVVPSVCYILRLYYCI